MSEREGGTKLDKQGKKAHKNHPVSYKYTQYSDGKKKGKECIKCGAGIFLAQHKDRMSCGKCGFTEFAGKK
ncbi:MAG: 30S ribosomal protein S27ae [Nanoarchaeota archaeon]